MRIANMTGRPFHECHRMVQTALHMQAQNNDLLKLPDEDQDNLVIDLGYCLDRVTLANHPYPRRARVRPSL